jgi:hypothetical protein
MKVYGSLLRRSESFNSTAHEFDGLTHVQAAEAVARNNFSRRIKNQHYWINADDTIEKLLSEGIKFQVYTWTEQTKPGREFYHEVTIEISYHVKPIRGDS